MRLLVLVSVLLLAACGDKPSDSSAAYQKYVGLSAQDVKVKTLDGEDQPLNDAFILEGKPVIVNVWATWCPPCLVEMPTLDALGKSGEYKVIAIATDKDAQTVKDFLREQSWGSGLTVLHDSLGAETRAKLGATALPVTYVLSPDLTIKRVEAGERDWNHPSMKKKISDSLK
jgi:thiol-disulfide isomerase/thioredoxin